MNKKHLFINKLGSLHHSLENYMLYMKSFKGEFCCGLIIYSKISHTHIYTTLHCHDEPQIPAVPVLKLFLYIAITFFRWWQGDVTGIVLTATICVNTILYMMQLLHLSVGMLSVVMVTMIITVGTDVLIDQKLLLLVFCHLSQWQGSLICSHNALVVMPSVTSETSDCCPCHALLWQQYRVLLHYTKYKTFDSWGTLIQKHR